MQKSNYTDFIRFYDAIGYRKGYCKLNDVHDGLIYFEFEQDKREYIIPRNSVLLIIRNVKGER